MKNKYIKDIISIGALFLGTSLAASTASADAWTRIYNETTQPPYNDDGQPHTDFGNDIILDSQGNIITTGCWHAIKGGVAWAPWVACNFYVAKFDSAGNKLWLQKIDTGWNVDEVGLKVQVDQNNNIYVIGTAAGDVTGTGQNIQGATPFIAKYDTYGNQLWIDQYADSNTKVTGLTTDKYGNSYVLGYEADTANGDDNVYVRKYYWNGQMAWHNVYNTAHTDRSNAITVDWNGWYIYFSTTTDDVESTNTYDTTDLVVRRIGNSGTLLWEQKFATTAADNATAIAIDMVNNQVVIGGQSLGTFPGMPKSSSVRDTYVSALNRFDGTMKWVKKDYAFEHGAIGINEIVIDSSGDFHITGKYGKNYTREYKWGNGIHYTRYDANGNREVFSHMGTIGTRDHAGGIAVDGSGNYFLTGGAAGDLNGVPSDASISEQDVFITKNMP